MELWIRSQDREELRKVEAIVLEKMFDGNGFKIIEKKDTYINYLGFYKTKERALEVLDEIENFIASDSKFEGAYKDTDLFLKSIIASNMVKIYNMPKE